MKRRDLLAAGASAAALTLLPSCGGKSGGQAVLNIYIWPDYLPDEVVKEFEKANNCRVQVDTFTSNEDMNTKVSSGKSGYDLVCPSPYAVAELMRASLLEKLDKSAMPNLANLDSRFKTIPADKEGDYAVPYLGGTTGIAYHKGKVTPPPTKWADIFDTTKLAAWKGKISVLDDARETTAIALLSLGLSPNTSNPDDLKKAGDLLKAQKPFLAKYDSETFEDSLIQGSADIVHGYSGDCMTALSENKELTYILPEEGAVFNVDCFCLLKEAKSKELAMKFLNYIHTPEVMVKIVTETGYIPVNSKALELAEPGLRDNPCWKLPPMEKLFVLESASQEVKDLYDKLWEDVKQA